MVANNILEVYTLIFGWNMYQVIWDILVGSGLALIPFIAAVVSSFKDNYEGGSAESAVKGVEICVISMIIVMMLCVIPYKGMPMKLSTVQYTLATPDCHPPANLTGTGDKTRPAFDEGFKNMGAIEAHKPVAWSLVEFISSAITHSVIKSMSCVNNYEFMLVRIGQITIQDSVLRARVKEFTEACYKKAINRYEKNPLALPADISPVDDIDWI
jgi:hypothetical protein